MKLLSQSTQSITFSTTKSNKFKETKWASVTSLRLCLWPQSNTQSNSRITSFPTEEMIMIEIHSRSEDFRRKFRD